MNVRVLVLDDRADDAALMLRELARSGLEATARVVESHADFLAALFDFRPDLILADRALPAFDGLTALALARQQVPEVPFLLVTGTMDESAAVETLRAGAADYVLKSNLSRLGPAARRAIDQRTERLALRESAEREQLILRSLPIIFYRSRLPDLAILWVSDNVEGLTGFPVARYLTEPGFISTRLHPDDRDRVLGRMRAMSRGDAASVEYRWQYADGDYRWHSNTAVLVEDAGGFGHLVGAILDITERRRAEEERREADERLKRMFEDSVLSIGLADPEGRFVSVNPAFAALVGYSSGELLAMRFADVTHPEDLESSRHLFQELLAGLRTSYKVDKRYRRKDGSSVWGRLTASLVRGADDRPYCLGIVEDITHEKDLEQRFLQSQKMEAVGRLAGGVAHEFNNLLTIIRGYGDEALEKLRPIDPLHADLVEIQRAAERATTLTRQLLAFSRRQVLHPEVLDVNALVRGVEGMVRRVIGEDVRLAVSLASEVGRVKADPGQIEQVLVTLAVHARDAMPRGGELAIRTANVFLEEDDLRAHPDGAPGRHVLIEVRDDGPGMDPETAAHLFEPFFKKLEGTGSGLGLSTVYGIVRQSGGHVRVESLPGRGTAFEIYLPRLDDAAPGTDARPAPAAERPLGSGETILLVEDDASVRRMTARQLRHAGYEVVEAARGDDALRLAAERAGGIDLLLTDVVMPGMSGRELADRLLERNPGTPVVFMSGYSDQVIGRHGVLEPGVAMIQKPFAPADLLATLRRALRPDDPAS